MKLYRRTVFFAVALSCSALASVAASRAPAPAADSSADSTGTQGTDEANLTDAQRAAEEKSAGAAAAAAKQAIDQANPRHLPAFPGAEGFGALATGGRGGTIVHVTNLNDAGAGSFRDAVSKPNRIVVFDVGGIIKIGKEVTVSSNITIAGQSAPGDGICIYGNGVSLGGESNIIVRYVRFRQGIAGDKGKKTLGMDKSSNIIIDHCDVEWGRWDDLGITQGSTAITVQNCIMAEGINPQSFGALIDTVTNITLSHNLWMSNESRNPKAKGTIQYINNVVYDWNITGLCGGHSAANHDLDVIANYFIKGPSSNNQFAGQFFPSDHVYQEGNFVDLDLDGALNGKPVTEAGFADKNGSPTFVKAPAMHPAIAVTVDSAQMAYAKIVASAGCSLHRDPVDARLIRELTSLGKAGKTLTHTNPAGEALAGGIGEIKSGALPAGAEKNGIPDDWEKAHGLDPNAPADALKPSSSGYLNIEVYLNGLATVTK
jgi:pectate lyase